MLVVTAHWEPPLNWTLNQTYQNISESLGIIFLTGLHPLSPEVGFNFFGPVSQDSMCDLYENVWPSGSNHFQPPDGQKMILCLLTLGFDLAIDERKTSRCQRFPVGVMVVQYGAIFRFLQAIRIWRSLFDIRCSTVLWVTSIPDVQFSRIFRGTAAVFSTSSLLGVSFS